MKVNVVVKKGWVLQRLAEELAARVPNVTINTGRDERRIDPNAEAHYYMPANDIRKYPNPGGLTIGFFTHGEDKLAYADRFDACVAMNVHMRDALLKWRARLVTLIRPGTDTPARPPVFGVVGRVYNNGRKGEHLVKAAIDAGFTFVACGTDHDIRAMSKTQWPCPTTHIIEDRSAFYRSIDYLVIPSLEEGGPMPVLEALAHRVPVIAPDVGWCWEFPCYRYEKGSAASLLSLLRGLTDVPTWVGWGEGHRRLIDVLASTTQATERLGASVGQISPGNAA